VLIRPVADGPVNWAKDVDDNNMKPINHAYPVDTGWCFGV
jgi:hypothetical protein